MASQRYASVKAVGRRIRALREARNMSGEQLGRAIGTDKGTVSRIEHGEAGLSYERAMKIARALGVEIEDLATRRGLEPRA